MFGVTTFMPGVCKVYRAGRAGACGPVDLETQPLAEVDALPPIFA